MAQKAFTILMPDQVKAFKTSLAADKQAVFETLIQTAREDRAKREAANRRGGRKPAKLYFTGEHTSNPMFDRDTDGKPLIVEGEKPRFAVTYYYSAVKGGKKVGSFFTGQLFKEDSEGLAGHGSVQRALALWEDYSPKRIGLTNEQVEAETAKMLQSFGEISCETVVVGKTVNGQDKFGYNLNSPDAEKWIEEFKKKYNL